MPRLLLAISISFVVGTCGGNIFGMKIMKIIRPMWTATEAARVMASHLASFFASGSMSRFASPVVKMSGWMTSRNAAVITWGLSKRAISAASGGSTERRTITRGGITGAGTGVVN